MSTGFPGGRRPGVHETNDAIAFNATLTIIALMLCNHVSGPEAPTSYEAIGTSDEALRETLAAALACLPMVDSPNKMVEKVSKFAAALNQCLHILGE